MAWARKLQRKSLTSGAIDADSAPGPSERGKGDGQGKDKEKAKAEGVGSGTRLANPRIRPKLKAFAICT